MTKLDLKRELKQLYTSSTEPNIIEVPEGKYLTIVGRGEPGGEAYRAALNALYSVAYTVKSKAKALGTDFTVMGLEGLWWWDKQEEGGFASPPREQWNWKSMIRQPELVTEEMVEAAKKEARKKRDLPELDRVGLEMYTEGLSTQILYIGPFSEEGAAVKRLHDFILESGYRPRLFHHEIYKTDPRRVPPEKLKTIIRQPVEKL